MKKSIYFLLCFMVFVSLSACGENKSHKTQYVKSAKALVEQINNSVNNATEYGNKIYGYREMIDSFNRGEHIVNGKSTYNIPFSMENALKYADESMENNNAPTRAEMNDTHRNIMATYEDVQSFKSNDEDVLNIAKKVNRLYEDYCVFYDFVMNEPETMYSYGTEIQYMSENLSNSCDDVLKSIQEYNK